MYLLDTNIVSELFVPRPHESVLNWVASRSPDELAISVVTIGEMQRGVELIRSRKPQRALAIEQWIDLVKVRYTPLPMDSAAFTLWAKLLVGRDDSLVLDAMIAATAITRDLTVATRNVRDFKTLGAKTYNPFDYRG